MTESPNIAARIDDEIKKRAKVYSAESGIPMQDIVEAALEEYLTKRGFGAKPETIVESKRAETRVQKGGAADEREKRAK